MFIFLLTLLLIVAAPILHITWCTLHLAGRTPVSFAAITFFCMVLGVAFPILASYIDIVNLPPDIKCATGSVGFAIIGIFITVVVIPISAIVFYSIAYYQRKRMTLNS